MKRSDGDTRGADAAASRKREPSISATGADGRRLQGDEVVCMCMNMTLADLQRRVSEGIGFDELLSTTGAGTRCTACLLDLEYWYERSPREARPFTVRRVGAEEGLSPRRKLWRLIDRMTPLMSYEVMEVAPVLYGKGVEQWLCVSNDTLMYAEQHVPPPLDLALTLRDGAGRTLHRVTERIEAGSVARIDVGSHFDGLATPIGARDGSASVGVGSFEVRRRWVRSGHRGATRPHFIINFPHGSCNLHTQAPGVSREQWLSCIHRPEHERVFVSFVNAQSAPLNVTLDYPVGFSGIEPERRLVQVPPHGTVLHEISLSDPAASAVGDSLMDVRLRSRGRRKAHLLFATPNLDRFSIDHLAT